LAARVREAERAARLGQAPSEVNAALPMSVTLHRCDADPIVRAAEGLGYTITPETSAESTGAMLLVAPSGERVVLDHDEDGHVVLESLGTSAPLDTIMQQHTLAGVREAFAARGMIMEQLVLPSGEIEIVATEVSGNGDGAARVTADVLPDGKVRVDVDCVQGSRCETFVEAVAEAIGGIVEASEKKDAAFQLPAEPVHTDVAV
jgi:hypothetical protein